LDYFNLVAGSTPVFRATYRHLLLMHDRGSYAIASVLLAVAAGFGCSLFIFWRDERRIGNRADRGGVKSSSSKGDIKALVLAVIALLFYFGFDFPILRKIVGDANTYTFVPLSVQNLAIVLLLATAAATSSQRPPHHAAH
jgi:hypothetical protein